MQIKRAKTFDEFCEAICFIYQAHYASHKLYRSILKDCGTIQTRLLVIDCANILDLKFTAEEKAHYAQAKQYYENRRKKLDGIEKSCIGEQIFVAVYKKSQDDFDYAFNIYGDCKRILEELVQLKGLREIDVTEQNTLFRRYRASDRKLKELDSLNNL